MHKGKVIFTGLLLIVLALIISYGCGGGDVITNPTPVASGNSGYLIIRVVWPQKGNSGDLLMLSGSEKEITASMPEDTKCVKIKVLQKANMNNLLGEALINMPETTVKIDHLSAEPVIIIAETYDTVIDPNDPNSSGLKPLSVSELDVVIRVGANSFNLDMGDYLLTVEPSIKKIALGETVKITATLTLKDSTGNSVASDGSLEGREIEFTITGNAPQKVNTGIDGKVEIQATGNEIGQMYIKAEFKPIPSDPNTFKVAETSVDISGSGRYVLTVTSSNSQVILSSKPADSKTSSIQANAAPVPSPEEVEISVNLMYIGPSQPGGSTPVPVAVEAKEIEFTATNSNNSSAGEFEPTSIITNGDGNGTSKLLFNNPGTITIKGSLKEDPTVYDECIITVNRDYYLQFAAGDVQIIPDFKTTNTDNIQQSKKTFISVELRKPDANDPLQSLIPAAEETITLTKEEGPGVIPASVVTDQDGHAYAEIDYSGYNGGSTQTIIKASFNNPINSNYTSEISTSFYFTVPIYVDTFEKYSYYTYVYDLYQWTAGYPYYASWIAGGEAKDVESFIDNIGANNTNQSIKLNSNDSPAWVTSKIGYWKTKVGPYYHITKELRFYICPEHDAKAVVTIGGMLGLSDIITFKDNKIYDAKGEEIENISYPANWYPVRVQILGSQSNPLEKIKLNYFMEGEFKKSIILPNLYISSDGICSLTLKSNSGNVWFDQIELYNDFYELN